MAKGTKIEWCSATWNPITGCSPISPGCDHCYAKSLARRLSGMARQPKYKNGFQLTMHRNELQIPFSWKRPQVVFPCSMSDIFHKKVEDEFIYSMFEVMKLLPEHVFLLLTKRPERLNELELEQWPRNVWMGVTAENQEMADYRLDVLRRCKAWRIFVSIEPMLEPINLKLTPDFVKRRYLKRLHWVIVGAEMGVGARHMDPEWVRGVREQCVSTRTPFFLKKMSDKGERLDNRMWRQRPKEIRDVLRRRLKRKKVG